MVIHTSVLRKLTVPRNGPLGKRDLIVVSCEIRKRWSTYWRGANEWDSTHVKPLPVSSKQRIFIYFSKTPCLKQHLTYEKGRLRWLCIFLHIYLSKFKTYPPPRSLTDVGRNLQTTCTSRSKPGSRHSFQFLSCDILFRRILRYDAIVFTLSKSYRHLRLLPGTQLAWSKGWLFWWWIGCASYGFFVLLTSTRNRSNPPFSHPWWKQNSSRDFCFRQYCFLLLFFAPIFYRTSLKYIYTF